MATDNELLTQISESLDELIRVEKGDYDSTESADIDVDEVLTVIAAAAATCAKRLVTNTGEVEFDVYEDGKLVCEKLQPTETWISDLDGGGAISVQCEADLTSTGTVTTYLRTS